MDGGAVAGAGGGTAARRRGAGPGGRGGGPGGCDPLSQPPPPPRSAPAHKVPEPEREQQRRVPAAAVRSARPAMPNFAGTWKMRSSENFDELLKALGEALGGGGQPAARGCVPRERGDAAGGCSRNRAPVPGCLQGRAPGRAPCADRGPESLPPARGKAVSPARGGATAGTARSEPHLRTPVVLPGRGGDPGRRWPRRLLPRSATGILARPRVCRRRGAGRKAAAPDRAELCRRARRGGRRPLASPRPAWCWASSARGTAGRFKLCFLPASPRCQRHAQEGGGGRRLQTPRGDPPGRGPVLHQNFHHCPHHGDQLQNRGEL